MGAGSPGRCGLPPGDKGGRSGSGPLAFFPSRHEQGPACRHSPGRPVRGRDNVAIVRAPQTGRAGRWEGRGAAGARALGAQRGPRTRTRSPRPGHAASRRPPGQPSAGQKLEGGWERKGGRRGSERKRCPRKEEMGGEEREGKSEKTGGRREGRPRAGRGGAGERGGKREERGKERREEDKAGREEGRWGSRGDRQTDRCAVCPGSLCKELKFTLFRGGKWLQTQQSQQSIITPGALLNYRSESRGWRKGHT